MKRRRHEYELEKYLVSTSDGEWEVAFGKYSSYLLSDAVARDPNYFLWMLSEEFPPPVLSLVEDALEVVGLPRRRS
jgi:uncharacterized protein (DUF3820 family)